MKYAQVVSEPDPDDVPEFFELLAESSCVNEARMYDSNVNSIDKPVALYEVDGDVDAFRDELHGVSGVREAVAKPVTEGRFNLLVVHDVEEASIMEDVLRAVTHKGIIVAKPVVYRNGKVHSRIVGDASTLQEAITDFPSEANFEVVTVGEFDRSRDTPVSALTDRQREALLAALDLGYYEHPRGATHEDVAERLGCESNTASEHIQKAEAKVLKEVLSFFDE
jgi:Predicted DNA binding protein